MKCEVRRAKCQGRGVRCQVSGEKGEVRREKAEVQDNAGGADCLEFRLQLAGVVGR